MSALDSPMKRMDINCDKENVAPPSSKTEKAEADKFSVPAIAPVAEPKVRISISNHYLNFDVKNQNSVKISPVALLPMCASSRWYYSRIPCAP